MSTASGPSFPHTIAIQVDAEFQRQVQPDLLQQAALATLIYMGMEEPYDLAVVVTDDAALHELNLRHRGVDSPTDVLAFPDDTRGPFVDAPGMPRYLGDIIISFPRAQAQAADAGHAVEAEIQLLLVHGVLHLLGYDDAVEEARARMWAAQADVLRLLEVDLHLPE
jgi:probable rRNA maturation factor